MPLEKFFTKSDILQCYKALSWLVLKNVVHEQRRMTVAQIVENRRNINRHGSQLDRISTTATRVNYGWRGNT